MALAVTMAEELTVDLQWQQGDVALVDNLRVMHGRRPFEGNDGYWLPWLPDQYCQQSDEEQSMRSRLGVGKQPLLITVVVMALLACSSPLETTSDGPPQRIEPDLLETLRL